MDEERPSFADTNDSDRDVSDFADTIIRQNQIINRALRRPIVHGLQERQSNVKKR